MKNKPNPDDRRDNVEKLQYQINHTISNYRETKDMIEETDDPDKKQRLIEKNKNRLDSLNGKREEIKEEAIAKEKGYK
jgi:small acid-soluble spore protein (thioredoxin-like protein)